MQLDIAVALTLSQTSETGKQQSLQRKQTGMINKNLAGRGQVGEADLMNAARQHQDRRIANEIPLALDALEVKTKRSRHFRDCLLTPKRSCRALSVVSASRSTEKAKPSK